MHGHSPYGQTISFNVERMPRWWKYHKGMDVSESEKEKRKIKRAEKRIAIKSRRNNNQRNNNNDGNNYDDPQW